MYLKNDHYIITQFFGITNTCIFLLFIRYDVFMQFSIYENLLLISSVDLIWTGTNFRSKSRNSLSLILLRK